MKITQARFIISLSENQDFPGRGLPQVAVVGRSNVGKSSLINCLTNQKKLAKTSQQPGLTRLINIFLINEQFHLVDLPGYGYAKVSKQMKEDWGVLLQSYLDESEELTRILHLVDIRHEPSEQDKIMANWISEADIPCIVVATKADKLSKSQGIRAIAQISRTLGVAPEDIVPFSSVTKLGKDELINRMF